MAWCRARVVAPVRLAWLAVAARARARKGIVDLHRDVQTCGYHDVQVMWNMLSSEKQTFSSFRAPEKQRRTSFWRPSSRYVRSPLRDPLDGCDSQRDIDGYDIVSALLPLQ